CSFRILMICSSLNRFFMLITPSAFYHIVTNFSIGSVFGAQVTFYHKEKWMWVIPILLFVVLFAIAVMLIGFNNFLSMFGL
ncbi:hypothetical protein, partial [Caproicibacter fermentans]|uniref:hypothetical protein n=1 Tax=Caproicibacter fermentans TaxID=2576756 RepID=UPI001A9ADB04